MALTDPHLHLVLPGTAVVDMRERDPTHHSAAQVLLESMLADKACTPERLVLCPSGVDPLSWQYEHLRVTLLSLNTLVALLADKCNSSTCPQMKATEQWLFYCAAHRTPRECCAIDYTIHTLDSATEILCNRKNFPDREKIAETASAHFQSIARRVYRIFAHAYYHHNDIYNAFEARKQASIICS